MTGVAMFAWPVTTTLILAQGASSGLARALCSIRLAVLALCAALILPAGSVAAQTPEGGTVKAQHGDWQVVCRPPPPGAKHEVCALVQSVTAEDRNNIGLTVYFQKFSDGKRVLRVFEIGRAHV